MIEDVATDAGLIDEQARLLDLIATGASPGTVLSELATGMERFLAGGRCSVLLYDEPTGTLRHGAAPRLPAGYCAAIDGMSTGPSAGSCGTAAYTGSIVIARDLTTDARWEDFRHLVFQYGMRSCWSSPIFSPDQRLLGTFAVYHDRPHEPASGEIELLGRFSHLAGVAIRHAELYGRVAASEEQFRRSFEDNAAGMALVRPDGIVAQANAALARLVGASAAGLIGRNLADLIDDDGAGGWSEAVDRLSAGLGHVPVALSFRRPDGVQVQTLGAVTMVHRSIGPARYCLSLVDITERQRAERERRARLAAEAARSAAEAASVAKGSFLTAMSHELRTPLTSIVGYSELLASLELTPERRGAAVDAISTAASHLIAILDDVLDLAKIEAGIVTVERRPVDVAKVATCAVNLLRPLAERRAVELTVADTEDRWVLSDQRRFTQVLLNVVGNAVKYNRAGGTVSIGAAAADRPGFVAVSVVDDGNGIPTALRDRLFTPFSRLDDGTNDAEGSGLGLAVSRQLVASMGGELAVSDNVPHGTTVVVRLPSA